MVAADVDRVLGVTSPQVEFPRCLRDLFEHELRIEAHGLAIDSLARLAKQLDRFGFAKLHSDLGDQAPPAPVDRLDRVRIEKFVPRHPVDKHRHLVPLGESPDACTRLKLTQ